MGRGSSETRTSLPLRAGPTEDEAALLEDWWRQGLRQLDLPIPDSGAYARFALVGTDGRTDTVDLHADPRDAVDHALMFLHDTRGFSSMWDLGARPGEEPARVALRVEHSVETEAAARRRPTPDELRWLAEHVVKNVRISNPEVINSGEARFIALLRDHREAEQAVAVSEADASALLGRLMHEPTALLLLYDIGVSTTRTALAWVNSRGSAVIDGRTVIAD